MGVQAALTPFDDILSFVSSASNPASVLHYLVPVLALFNQGLALQIVVSYVVADISNLAMKWPLQGDRPYWMDPGVRQFGHNTCEVFAQTHSLVGHSTENRATFCLTNMTDMFRS
jgi:hypothetical protein